MTITFASDGFANITYEEEFPEREARWWVEGNFLHMTPGSRGVGTRAALLFDKLRQSFLGHLISPQEGSAEIVEVGGLNLKLKTDAVSTSVYERVPN